MSNPVRSVRSRHHSFSFLLGALGSLLLILGSAPAISETSTTTEVPGALGVFVRGSNALTPGTEAALRIATHAAPAERESRPQSGVSVTVSMAGGGKTVRLTEGVTDKSGTFDARFVVPNWPAGKYKLSIRSRVADQESAHEHAVELMPASRTLVQSDKPLYQPGQVVHLRSLTLRSQDGRPLQAGMMRFVVEDPRKNIVLQRDQPLSAFGIASVDLPLAEELLLGRYVVRAELQSSISTPPAKPAELAIEVSRYVLPKLKVALSTDLNFYEPGAEVRFAVGAQYFQGKPVQGGAVTVNAHLQGSGVYTPLPTLSGRLDERGSLAMKLQIPSDAKGDDLKLSLDATVEDEATQRARTHSEILIAQTPVQLDIVAEADQLIPEIANRVYVLTVRPDGSPFPDAPVEVTFGSSTTVVRARSSAIGIATVEHRVAKLEPGAVPDPACSKGELLVKAQVTPPGRTPIREQSCMKVRAEGGLLLRADRAVYQRGDAISLSVSAPAVKEGFCFVDVVRDEQLQDTLIVPIHHGKGAATIRPSERMAGTVALMAYVVSPDGKQVRDGRLVYIERPSALRVLAETELANGEKGRPLRPGDEARLRLKVVDADSGVGVQSAVGLVMIDEALLALRPLRPGLLRAYFTIGESARKAAALRRFVPGGVGMDALVEKGGLSDLEQSAAQLLLSGASPPWASGWETDPWAERKEAFAKLEKKWEQALVHYAKGNSIGERLPGDRTKWRFREALPGLLRGAGLLTVGELRDPWRRPLTTAMLMTAAKLSTFEHFAEGLLDEKLTTLYRALWKQIEPELLSGKRAKERDGSFLITEEDVKRLGDAMLLDPWGSVMRLQTRKKMHKIGPLKSKGVLYSAGPDGVFGNADDLYPSDNLCYHHSCPGREGAIVVVGVSAHKAFGEISVGCGCGYGAAAGAMFGSRAAHSVSVAYGSAEMRGVAGKKDSVRSSFPETLLYRPEILTDEKGEATVPITMADSITTWRLLAEAVAQDGRLGSLMMGVPVSQDFFVDLDLPPIITQHDELAVPVPVYNHQKLAQKVTLTLLQDPWFEPLGPLVETIELGPGQAGVRYFRIKAGSVGRQALRLSARGTVASDAVERRLEVVPDGIERVHSVQQRLTARQVSHSVSVPAMVIPGTSELTLKLYPAPAAHVVEGLDSLLRMPHGCFEQTSSSTYPNALILQYLRRSHRSTPEVERKAMEYLTMGYQKLLSFEVPSGGFSWFGNAPAHKVLTAYGLEEFADMSEVFPVDQKVIARTQKWLLSQQTADGSFDPDASGIREGAINAVSDDRLRTTAYVALTIKRTDSHGSHQAAIDRAKEYVRRALNQQVSHDPYTLALVTELIGGGFVPSAGKAEEARSLMDRLWDTRKSGQDGRSLYFQPSSSTPTHGNGKSGIVETTAMVATALHRSSLQGRSVGPLSYLAASKDSFGTWHSTQATIRALKALLLQQGDLHKPVVGTLDVFWNGAKHTTLKLSGQQDGLQIVTLPAPPPGNHQLALEFAGQGLLDYQLVSRHYTPREPGMAEPPSLGSGAESAPITISTEVSTKELKREQTVVQTAHLLAQREVMMPLVSVGIPPGFSVEREPLDEMVVRGQIEKYEIMPRYLTLYLRKLSAKEAKNYPITLLAHLPGRVQVPAASVYPYYEPELRSQASPLMLIVRE